MDFSKNFILSMDSDSDIEVEDQDDEWSSSSDEDESKVTLIQKKIYKSYQFFPNFTDWDEIETLLTNEGIEPRKSELPSLDQLLKIVKIPDKRSRSKSFASCGVKSSDFKYYLPLDNKSEEFEKIWKTQKEIQKQEDVVVSSKISDDLKAFQESCFGPFTKTKNFIQNAPVNCAKQSYVLNVVLSTMSSIAPIKAYKFWYKLDFVYDIAEQSGGAFLDVECVEGLCDDNVLTRMCFEYLSIDEDILFERLGNGVTSCCHQRAILKLLPYLNNLGVPNRTSEEYPYYNEEARQKSKKDVKRRLEQFECFILRPSQGLTNEKHIAKSRKNNLKNIDKWIQKQKLITPCFTNPSCGYIVNIVQAKKVWNNPNYIISVTPMNNPKKEIYAYPHITSFSNLLIEWLVTPGYPRGMYKAIAYCLAEIGT
jgi:hypothetical protein